MPLYVRRPHIRFGIDAQGVGDAIDIVEVGNDLDRIEDVPVAQSVLAQRVQVPWQQGPGARVTISANLHSAFWRGSRRARL